MLAGDSQMTTGFFTLRPVKDWEKNHSQMTTSFLLLLPTTTHFEVINSQMTTSFFMLQRWIQDSGCTMIDVKFSTLDNRCWIFEARIAYLVKREAYCVSHEVYRGRERNLYAISLSNCPK